MNKINQTGFALCFVPIAVATLTIPAFHDVQADEPEILDAKAEVQANSLYAFSVTLKHPDAGWSHYADGWDILDSNGKKIETRTLYHPHGDNEPFTRSLANVKIPIGMNFVTIRANCSVDGPAQKLYRLELPPR